MYKLADGYDGTSIVQRISDGAYIPKVDGNRDYTDFLEWIAEGNTPTPEFTDAEITVNAQAVSNQSSLAYLASTDWYVTRHAETAEAVPADVTSARAAARAAIV